MAYLEGRKKGHVLFNKIFNTFFLWLYAIGNMVTGHSVSKRGNPLPELRGLLFLISSKDLLYAPSHRQNSPYLSVLGH